MRLRAKCTYMGFWWVTSLTHRLTCANVIISAMALGVSLGCNLRQASCLICAARTDYCAGNLFWLAGKICSRGMLREFKLGAILGVCFLRQRVCACGEGQRSGDARWLVLGREL